MPRLSRKKRTPKAPSIEDHNRVLRLAEARALKLEDRLVAILEPILNRAGDEAASAFSRMATDHLQAAGQPGVKSTSTMVCVKPTREEAARIAKAGALDASTLHVTLAYLGDVEGDLEPVVAAIRAVGAVTGPLSGTVGGVGLFAPGPDGAPVIALPDVPGLVELRVKVTEALVEAGIQYSRDHGFCAHMTLDYTPTVEAGFDGDMPFGEPLTFDEVYVVRGDVEVHPVPLVGRPPLTADAFLDQLTEAFLKPIDNPGAPVASLTIGPLRASAPPPPWGAPAGDEVLDVDKLVKSLRTKTDPVRRAVIETTMKKSLNGAGIDFDVTNPLTAKVLAQSASQVTNIAETTRLNVMKTIKASYDQGLTIPDTATAIRAGMRDASPARARLIARTELAGAVNGGSLAATQIVSDATGLNYDKEWMTAPGAPNPRHELVDGLDGQTVPLDGMFDVEGEQLEFPGDPNGSPENVCNCRCTMSYVEPGGQVVEAGDAESGILAPEDVAAAEGGDIGGLGGIGGEGLVPVDALPPVPAPMDLGGGVQVAPVDYTALTDVPLPSEYTAGSVENFERFDPVQRWLIDNDHSDMEIEREYNAMSSQLQKEIEAAKWEDHSAAYEASQATDRVGVDAIKVARDDAGNMVGIVDYNPGMTVSALKTEIANVEESISYGGLPEDLAVDRQMLADFQAQLAREEANPSVYGINHLASTGQEQGVGTRLMREVAKEAAADGKGIGLNSLSESKGFYEKLGMTEKERGNYYFTPEETARFARGEDVAPKIVRQETSEALTDGPATEVLDRQYEEWGKALTTDETDALWAYREQEGFKKINGELRAGKVTGDLIHLTEDSDSWVPTKTGMSVSTAVRILDQVIEAAPETAVPLDMTMFRGVQRFDKVFGEGGPKVGQVVTEKAYTSTSTEASSAMNYALTYDRVAGRIGFEGSGLIEVHVPAGTKGAWIRGVSVKMDGAAEELGNSEMVLARNAEFRVVSVEERDVYDFAPTPGSELRSAFDDMYHAGDKVNVVKVELVPRAVNETGVAKEESQVVQSLASARVDAEEAKQALSKVDVAEAERVQQNTLWDPSSGTRIPEALNHANAQMEIVNALDNAVKPGYMVNPETHVIYGVDRTPVAAINFTVKTSAVYVEHLGSTVKGGGTELLRVAAKRAIESGADYVHLQAVEEQVGFYEKLGFRVLDTETHEMALDGEALRKFAGVTAKKETVVAERKVVEEKSRHVVVEKEQVKKPGGEEEWKGPKLSDDVYVASLQRELYSTNNVINYMNRKVKAGTATVEDKHRLEALRKRKEDVRALIAAPDPKGELSRVRNQINYMKRKVRDGSATHETHVRLAILEARAKELAGLSKGSAGKIAKDTRAALKRINDESDAALGKAEAKRVQDARAREAERAKGAVNYSSRYDMQEFLANKAVGEVVEIPEHDIYLGGDVYKSGRAYAWRDASGVVVKREATGPGDTIDGLHQNDIQSKVALKLSGVPERMQGKLQMVTIAKGFNPGDAYWQKVYKGFTHAAATGGDGEIHFWQGDWTVNQNTFDHEMGHVVGENYGPVDPSEWTAAATRDKEASAKVIKGATHDMLFNTSGKTVILGGRAVTDYGSNSAAEDWAESVRLWLQSKRDGRIGSVSTAPGVAKDVTFADVFPARAKILDREFGP